MIKKIIFLLLICFSAPLFHAQAYEADDDYNFYKKYGNDNKAWNDLVRQGFEAYGRQDCDAALQSLKQAISQQCQDGLVYFKLGVCSEKTGSDYTAIQYYQLAEEKLKALKSLHRYQKEIYENYGRALFRVQRYKEALPYLQQAATLGSQNFGLYFMVGFLLEKNNRLPEALDYYQRAVSLDAAGVPPPLLAKAYAAVARAQFQKKDYTAAKVSLDKALSLDPTNADANSLRSQNENALRQVNIIQNLENITQQALGTGDLSNMIDMPQLPGAAPKPETPSLPPVLTPAPVTPEPAPPVSGPPSSPTTPGRLEPLPPVGGK